MNSEPSWITRVDAYLSYRRSLGFSLDAEARYLPQFARFAERRHAKHLTVRLAMETEDPVYASRSHHTSSKFCQVLPEIRSRRAGSASGCFWDYASAAGTSHLH